VEAQTSYWQFIRAEWRLLIGALLLGLLSLGCVLASVSQFVQFLSANQPLQAPEMAFRAALHLLVGFVNLWWLWSAKWRPLPLEVLTCILCVMGLVSAWVSFVLFLAANRQGFGYVIVALALLAAWVYCTRKCKGLIDRLRGKYFLWKHMDLIRDMINDAGLSR
jgi:hypothetical protein